MKRNIFYSRMFYTAALLVAAACALFVAGCKPEEDSGEAVDTTWLIGSWANAESGTSFTIAANLSFECDIYLQKNPRDQKARIRGRLDKSDSKLGRNEFKFVGLLLAQPGDPDSSYTGNANDLQSTLDIFSRDLVAALTPNGDKTEFKFTSNIPIADMFFGGDYAKPPEEFWLIGTWSNAESGASFTIAADLTFEADIYPMDGQKARVSGILDNSNPKLEENQYIIDKMVAAKPGQPDPSYNGNAIMSAGILGAFNGKLMPTLTPVNEDKTEFIFTSNSETADMFFGGKYTKQVKSEEGGNN